MGEENATSGMGSGGPGARTRYQTALLLLGIFQLLAAGVILYVAVAASSWVAGVAGIATAGLGINNLMVHRQKKTSLPRGW